MTNIELTPKEWEKDENYFDRNEFLSNIDGEFDFDQEEDSEGEDECDYEYTYEYNYDVYK